MTGVVASTSESGSESELSESEAEPLAVGPGQAADIEDVQQLSDAEVAQLLRGKPNLDRLRALEDKIMDEEAAAELEREEKALEREQRRELRELRRLQRGQGGSEEVSESTEASRPERSASLFSASLEPTEAELQEIARENAESQLSEEGQRLLGFRRPKTNEAAFAAKYAEKGKYFYKRAIGKEQQADPDALEEHELVHDKKVEARVSFYVEVEGVFGVIVRTKVPPSPDVARTWYNLLWKVLELARGKTALGVQPTLLIIQIDTEDYPVDPEVALEAQTALTGAFIIKYRIVETMARPPIYEFQIVAPKFE